MAQRGARLDAVEEELFRLGRTVAGSPELRKALDDRTAPVAARRRLVAELISAKVDPNEEQTILDILSQDDEETTQTRIDLMF